MKSLSQIMNEWRAEGYAGEIAIDKNRTASIEGKKLDKSKLRIDKHERFEGDSNPSDMSILFAISEEGKKLGLIVDSYDPKVESETSAFLKGLEDVD